MGDEECVNPFQFSFGFLMRACTRSQLPHSEALAAAPLCRRHYQGGKERSNAGPSAVHGNTLLVTVVTVGLPPCHLPFTSHISSHLANILRVGGLAATPRPSPRPRAIPGLGSPDIALARLPDSEPGASSPPNIRTRVPRSSALHRCSYFVSVSSMPPLKSAHRGARYGSDRRRDIRH